MSTLAEILAEAKKLEGELNSEFACALVGVAQRRDVKRARRVLDAFYAEHFPHLARVAEAAATMRNNIAELTQFGCQPSNADIVDELERFDAAVRGEEEANVKP